MIAIPVITIGAYFTAVNLIPIAVESIIKMRMRIRKEKREKITAFQTDVYTSFKDKKYLVGRIILKMWFSPAEKQLRVKNKEDRMKKVFVNYFGKLKSTEILSAEKRSLILKDVKSLLDSIFSSDGIKIHKVSYDVKVIK